MALKALHLRMKEVRKKSLTVLDVSSKQSGLTSKRQVEVWDHAGGDGNGRENVVYYQGTSLLPWTDLRVSE